MKFFMLAVILVFELFAGNVFTKKARQRSITIYNNNIAFIQEKKNFTLAKSGENYIVYEGVPNSIVKDSIIPEFSKKGTFLFSQTFEKNRVDIQRLISYYKKNNIQIEFFKPTDKADIRILSKGYVLSNFGNVITIRDNNSKIYPISYKDIVFPTLPKELSLSKPSLKWRVKGIKGKQSIKLSYLAKGLSWNANYTLNLNKNANFDGWITIDNRSGISYKKMNIFCMAGNVHIERNTRTGIMFERVISVRSDKTAVTNESFSGYHLYKIPFLEDIEQGSKQINFLSKQNIKYDEYAKLDFNLPLYPLKRMRKFNFSHIIHIKNNKSSNLGLPLPKGKIRVFKKDKSLQNHFIGESSIAHTPKNSDIYLDIGKYFDIKAKVKQLIFKATKNRKYIYTKIKVLLSNADKSPKNVKIKVFYNIYGNYSLKSSCRGICKETNTQSGYSVYMMKLNAHTNYDFDITYELNN